ncbi:MAG: NUDIX hydrolase [Anaerolineae bacterium]|nr:NUDIX hydrolase [Anaerolineae bacterium]
MPDFTEKTLNSESIYSGRVIKLQVDSVELPNGQTSKREVIKHPGAVAMVPIDSDGRVIMVEQYRYTIGKMTLEIPAGTLKPDEDVVVCAERELQEETGYKPGKLVKLGAIYLAPGYSTELIHLFLATQLVESPLNMDEDEFIEVKRLSFSEIIAQIAEGKIQDAKTISAIMMARQKLEK